MLVLNRRIGETIVLQDQWSTGGPIVVTICDVRGEHVQVGLDAPANVHIRRMELPPRPAAETAIDIAEQGGLPCTDAATRS